MYYPDFDLILKILKMVDERNGGDRRVIIRSNAVQTREIVVDGFSREEIWRAVKFIGSQQLAMCLNMNSYDKYSSPVAECAAYYEDIQLMYLLPRGITFMTYTCYDDCGVWDKAKASYELSLLGLFETMLSLAYQQCNQRECPFCSE